MNPVLLAFPIDQIAFAWLLGVALVIIILGNFWADISQFLKRIPIFLKKKIGRKS